jgi:molybdenum cofactor cytidylyltransferase
VLLGDMPWTKPVHIDALIHAFEPGVVCVPVRNGRRGNPVLWGRDFFPELMELTGDRGARDVLKRHEASVRRIELDTDAIFVDIDTPLDLARERAGYPHALESD